MAKKPTTKTFETANKVFLAELEKQVEETTLKGYQTCANCINAFMGSKRIAKMSHHDLFQFINHTLCEVTHRNGKVGYAKSTRKNIASYLNQLFEYFYSKEELRKNICATKIKVVGNNDRGAVKTYSSQITDTLKQADSYLSLVALFIMSIGLRPSEVVALTESSVYRDDLGHVLLLVDKAAPLGKIKTTKNKASERKIVLSPLSVDFLQRLLQKQGRALESVLVSTSENALLNSPQSHERFHGSKSLYIHLRKEFERLRIPFYGVKPCRHTFATRCATQGMPFEDLAGYLGHSSTEMVKSLYIDKGQYIHGQGHQGYLANIMN
ncbi:tyrosine-type recombinase/integrase [Vibrio parahaemolyticus]|uniref:tyrosine-type recombinase/integrase n=1 Tax=Vibrio parahaemolyticus TaxID=670 RepID=UPI001A343260|nr:tyrosine-type recombinase/integrase [Vibrio parahaemolyticus]MBO0177204.1 tyrosine-type recombinase/integrase [Vibrio parahaemolyticus]MDF4288795.1 tyrosine-type recombinase/integrase [Vibrio parahaemolyticus]MDF4303190.1 tyrosine-type recombinase/integrase [Vibrio parahaemolyticus]MDF5288486.1 tyrosine-type recombinase/integrase [Vibrio parahaemolyticus]MDF5293662.1 tyrosine-type recombinase/integrase [Vibrio parahaemolyticus]